MEHVGIELDTEAVCFHQVRNEADPKQKPSGTLASHGTHMSFLISR